MVDSPYRKQYIKTKDVMQFMAYDDKTHTMRFIGDTLECRVQKRYEVYHQLEIADVVTAPCLMDLIINDTYQVSLLALSRVTMEYTHMSSMTYDNQEYVVIHLETGNLFNTQTQVIKDMSLAYAVYQECISFGRPPYFIGYHDLARIFDSAGELCDMKLATDRVIFETIYAHLARDPSNMRVQYRTIKDRTDKPFRLTALRQVSFAPDGTMALMMGSYFSEASNAALLEQRTTHQPFENLIRGKRPDEING